MYAAVNKNVKAETPRQVMWYPPFTLEVAGCLIEFMPGIVYRVGE
jgi:hypothetical protein